MPEIGLQHALTYRQEIVAPLFDLLRSGESATVVGPASMGKSRLLQFLLRHDVQQHYLVDAATYACLMSTNSNRLTTTSDSVPDEPPLAELVESTAGLSQQRATGRTIRIRRCPQT